MCGLNFDGNPSLLGNYNLPICFVIGFSIYAVTYTHPAVVAQAGFFFLAIMIMRSIKATNMCYG